MNVPPARLLFIPALVLLLTSSTAAGSAKVVQASSDKQWTKAISM